MEIRDAFELILTVNETSLSKIAAIAFKKSERMIEQINKNQERINQIKSSELDSKKIKEISLLENQSANYAKRVKEIEEAIQLIKKCP